MMPSINPAGDMAPIPFDYNLMSKRSNILMGNLLQEAGFISLPTLEAALKLQELVRDEKLSPEQAPEVLKKLHSMGRNIDQYLSDADLTPAGQRARTGGPQPGGGQRAGAPPPGVSEQKAAFDLLQKAGLLNENDLKTASEVRRKHGGDMVQILQSAGKLDVTTYEAASICLPLIREGLMKVEQCIIALNYCNRSRVGFDAALEELGWPNPRKR